MTLEDFEKQHPSLKGKPIHIKGILELLGDGPQGYIDVNVLDPEDVAQTQTDNAIIEKELDELENDALEGGLTDQLKGGLDRLRNRLLAGKNVSRVESEWCKINNPKHNVGGCFYKHTPEQERRYLNQKIADLLVENIELKKNSVRVDDLKQAIESNFHVILSTRKCCCKEIKRPCSSEHCAQIWNLAKELGLGGDE